MRAFVRSRRLAGLLSVLGLAATGQAVEPEPVTFQTFDKVRISADYYAPKSDHASAPMAILLHMYRSDRSSWKPLIEPLHEAGFAILAIDLRGHGRSGTDEIRDRVRRRETAVFEAMYQDVRAAYDFLARQENVDRSRFALIGASIGCSVSLRYAVKDRSVDALMCLSPGASYMGLDSKEDIRNVKGRKIWLIAADDMKERRGVEALAPLGEGVKTKLVPGDAHGTRMFGTVPGLEREIAEWLKENVGGPTDTTVYGSINSHIYHLPGSGWIPRIKLTNLRHYSSPAEAISRGLRKAKSRAPGDYPGKDKRKP
jgi:pimeloyl-ACP methyl ester carboxylesterase